jgi:hypothetical protein
MRSRKRQWLILSVVALIALTGCAKRPVTGTSAAPAPTGAPAATEGTPTHPDTAPAPLPTVPAPSGPAPAAPPSPPRPSPRDVAAVPPLQDIHVDLDR